MIIEVTPNQPAVNESPRQVELPLVLHPRVVTGTGGGPDKTILNSPRFLKELGYRALCLYLHPEGDEGFQAIRARAAQWSAPLAELNDRGAFDYRIVTEATRLCREHRVAIWHGHDYKTNLLGLLVRRQWPMRLASTVHGWVHHTWRTPLYYALDRWALRRYERVLCVSPDLVDQCRRSGISDERLVLVENAIDTEQFSRRQSTAAAKQALGWPPERLLLGSVGRLSDEKGFDVLLRALAQLVERGHDVGLVLAGEGPAETSLRDLCTALRLDDRVQFLGFRSDVQPIYEAMDVYVLSSYREGLPNVLLEAMALEVPIVATRVAGVPRLITDGESGLLVDSGKSDQLTCAIERLLQDDALRQTLVASGRQTVETRYSFRRRMEIVAGIYDALLEKPAAK